VLVLTAILLFPPLFFSRSLLRVWQEGVYYYGDLARRLGMEFEAKWIGPEQKVDADALGLQDFSSTTDLYGVVANVYSMRLVLFDLRIVVGLIVAAVLPFVPIWLSAIPAKTVLDHLVGLLL